MKHVLYIDGNVGIYEGEKFYKEDDCVVSGTPHYKKVLKKEALALYPSRQEAKAAGKRILLRRAAHDTQTK